MQPPKAHAHFPLAHWLFPLQLSPVHFLLPETQTPQHLLDAQTEFDEHGTPLAAFETHAPLTQIFPLLLVLDVVHATHTEAQCVDEHWPPEVHGVPFPNLFTQLGIAQN